MNLSCSPWPLALLPIALLLLLLLTFIIAKLSIQQHLLFSFLLLVSENPITTPLSSRGWEIGRMERIMYFQEIWFWILHAVRLLGPPARFEASKLEVLLKGEEADTCSSIVPRMYTLSHCDFTANLTLTISNNIQYNQLKGWYNKDDVIAEWTEVKGNLFLDVHCYVSGPNTLQELAAEFRYHIFSKELPLVLEAVLYGDSDFFKEHEELMNAIVRVYFHSSSKKYNRVECWGPLKDAAKGRQGDYINGLLSTSKEDFHPPKIQGSAKSIFQALFTFLL